MRALVTAPGNTATIQDIPVPEPGANEIRIKVHSVALNPVDALYTFNPPAPPGRVVGSDIAGTVDKLGPGVTLWRVGDRVASFLQGATSGNERPGGFAEYAVVEADLAIAIPKEVSFDQAATVPLCSLTAAQALFIRLKIKPPFPSPFTYVPESAQSPTILIYSAMTSLGLFVSELSKLLRTSAGNPYRIFATASPKNLDKLLQLGVEKVFDYRDPEWPRKVRAASGGIHYAVDCISEGDSTANISQTYKEGGGTIACIRKSTWSKDNVREDVIGIYSSVWVGLGKDIIYNNELIPADPSWREFTVEFYRWLSSSTDRFPISPNPVRLMPGGLGRIVADGFTLLGSAKVIDRPMDANTHGSEPWMKPISGEKLVYRA
ncbi:chaperonin 10-like protein [Cristinia sonorae]|uniref:Chaperonin 10-like protein n=1 Tax=Cristinia sonorae TaxID=1940300 RepID=A0A8K0XPJ1_9AGAR|nr:chaperonin 10-like protein [Cristinia sonorae]